MSGEPSADEGPVQQQQQQEQEQEQHHSHPHDNDAMQEFLNRRKRLLFGERIVFVLDGDSEEMRGEWEPGSGKTRMEATADAIRMIIRRKLNATLHHTFAIASYNSESLVTWWTGFTTDFEALDEALVAMSRVEWGGEGEGPVKLTAVFNQLSHAVMTAVERDTQQNVTKVDAITRYIFVYSRSAQVPEYAATRPIFCVPSAYVPAATTPYLDVLFLHHKLTVHREYAASCQETLNVLSLIQRGDSNEEDDGESYVDENNYLFETHASNMRLMTYAALLCAHPAHRDDQTDMLTKLNVNEATLQTVREVDEAGRLEEIKARQQQCVSNKAKSQTSTLTGSALHVANIPSTASSSSSSTKNIGDVAADTVKSMFGFGSKSKKGASESVAHDGSSY